MSPRRSSARISSWIAAGLSVLTIVLGAVAVVTYALREAAGDFPHSGFRYLGLDPTVSMGAVLLVTVLGLAYALVGGLIATRRPGNLIGWALLFGGFGVVESIATGGYGWLALSGQPEWELPFGRLVFASGGAGWVPMIVTTFLLLLLFPNDRLPSPGWRTGAMVVIGGCVLVWLAYTTSPNLPTPYEDLANPLRIVGPDLTQEADLLQVILFVPISLAAIGLVGRFRRSRGDEREQFKWLAAAAALLVISLPIAIAGKYVGLASLPMAAALMGLPVAVGIAVLKHRLYDIDRLISRTLVYALLSAGLAATYLGLVVALQEVLRPISGGSDLAVVMTTLVVAVLSFPARRWLQNAVDRRFNRRTYDASRTIDAFSLRLREQVDLVTLESEMLAVVEGTMQPSGASLWLKASTAQPEHASSLQRHRS